MKIKEVIIYGDSTSLPRPNDSISTTDTWYWKLIVYSDYQFGLENRSTGGITISQLRRKIINDAHYLFPNKNSTNKQKLVFLHIGIVDAGVHPITYKLKIVNKIPLVGGYIWKVLARILKPTRGRVQRIWSYSNTSPRRYSRELSRIIKLLTESNVKVCVLLTPIPHKNLEVRSPGLRNNVVIYNEIKKRLVNKFKGVILINLDEFKDSYYVNEKDGHHFSKSGHEYVFNKIILEVDFENF